MKRACLKYCIPFLLLAVTATAQDPDRHGNLKLSSTSAPNNNQVNVQLDWPALDGNYYFIELTNRLDEPFAPIQLFAGAHADGEGKLGLDLQTTAPTGFYRLFITDDETHLRLLADDDDDKISNLLEAQAGWDAYEQPDDLTLDTDNDSLPDYWENFHFGNLDKDGAGDADGDGVSNKNEFSFGDNPQAEETERTTFSFQVTDNLTETRTNRDGGLFVTPLMRRTGQVSNSYRWDLKEAQHYTKHRFDVHEYADEYEGSGIDRDSFAVSYIYDISFGEPDGSGGYLDDAFYAGQKNESSGSYSLTSFNGAPITMLVEHHERALEIITGDHTEDHQTIETGVVDYEVIYWDGQSLTIDGEPVTLPTQERGCIYPYGWVRLPFLVDLGYLVDEQEHPIGAEYNLFDGPQRYLKGRRINFELEGAEDIPSAQIDWDGTFGATSTGGGHRTWKVYLDPASSSDIDYKTVIAEIASSVVAEDEILVCKYVLGIHSNAGPDNHFTSSHAWITVADWTNGTNPSVTRFGLWPDEHQRTINNGDGSDVRMNLEKSDLGAYNRFYLLSPSEYQNLINFKNQNAEWTYFNTCANWAMDAVQAAVREKVDASDTVFFGTPRKISESIISLEAEEPTTGLEPRDSGADIKEGSSTGNSTWTGTSF